MDRVAMPRRGIVLEVVTVGYDAVEGIVAIVAGIAAGSAALTGFGVDSVIEVGFHSLGNDTRNCAHIRGLC